MKIKSYSGDEPHPDYGGWENFLKSHCEVRGNCRGVVWYGATNCNYILFPDGTLIQNYGFHGKSLMNKVAEKGPEQVLAEIKQYHAELKVAMLAYADALTALTESLKRARVRHA
jgi:hypothetical protein